VAKATIERHRCQTLAGEQLGKGLTDLFLECTACPLHVAWTPPFGRDGYLPLAKSELCSQARTNKQTEARCLQYERACLNRTMRCLQNGCTFVCPFGIQMHWIALNAEDLELGVLYFCCPPTEPIKVNGSTEKQRPNKTPRFRLAVRLLRLIRNSVRDSVLAGTLQDTVEVLVARMRTQKRLATVPRLRTEGSPEHDDTGLPNGRSRNHREQIVQRILEHVHQHYDQPLMLRRFSDEFGVSLAHLSTLFSQTVGMPFRSYVKELRLDRSEKMLGDPRFRVSEVAYASGYSSPNRFRLDFKARTGLSPSAWRDTFAGGGE